MLASSTCGEWASQIPKANAGTRNASAATAMNRRLNHTAAGKVRVAKVATARAGFDRLR